MRVNGLLLPYVKDYRVTVKQSNRPFESKLFEVAAVRHPVTFLDVLFGRGATFEAGPC